MNRRQKARKRARAHAHHRSVLRFDTAGLIQDGTVTVFARDGKMLDEPEVTAIQLTQDANESGFAATEAGQRVRPSRVGRSLRKGIAKAVMTHPDLPGVEVEIEQHERRVTGNTLPIVTMQEALGSAIAKARRQKKSAVLLREMAKAGYVPREGVEPKPSTTTVQDWQDA